MRTFRKGWQKEKRYKTKCRCIKLRFNASWPVKGRETSKAILISFNSKWEIFLTQNYLLICLMWRAFIFVKLMCVAIYSSSVLFIRNRPSFLPFAINIKWLPLWQSVAQKETKLFLSQNIVHCRALYAYQNRMNKQKNILVASFLTKR